MDLSRWKRGSRNAEHVFPSQFGFLMLKDRHSYAHKVRLKKTLAGETRLIPRHFYKGYSMLF